MEYGYTPPPIGVEEARARASRVGLAFFLLVLVEEIAAVIIQSVVSAASPSLLRTDWFIFVFSFVCYYICGAPAALVALRDVPATPPEKKRITPSLFLFFFFIMSFCMVLGSFIGVYVNRAISFLIGREQTSGITEAINESGLTVTVIYTCVVAPVLEELFFRKLLIDRLLPLGEGVAILTSGIFFGLFHGNLDQFFYAALIGTVSALVYTKTGRLLYSILLHSLLNFFGGVLPTIAERLFPAFFEAETDEALTTFISEHIPATVFIFLSEFLPYLFAAVGLVLFVLRIRPLLRSIRPSPLPRGQRFSITAVNAGVILYFSVCLFEILLSMFL